jgi:uncharacterized protein DUF4062
VKIYISSTFEDLKDERERVYRQLRKLRHDVISMEDYVAGEQRPLDECLADVADCDAYVALIAWRYGFVPRKDNPEKRSITELEYRQAVRSGKTPLIFLVDEEAPWKRALMDEVTGEGDGGECINRFRAELKDSHVVGMFRNADQLASDVVAAVYRIEFEERTAKALATASPETRAPAPGADPTGAMTRDGRWKLWKPGITLRVRFLDGSPRQHRLVERVAPIWSAYANIRFAFVGDAEAEIRVSFAAPGDWSYLGTDALNIKDDPTINLGGIRDDAPTTDADQTILHEFGHVLGLYHEHQNPLAEIPWDKDAVFRAYSGPPTHWPEEAIEHNMFRPFSEDYFPVAKPFDPESIMAYPMPAGFTAPGFEFGHKGTLSAGDRAFIEVIYPFEE